LHMMMIETVVLFSLLIEVSILSVVYSASYDNGFRVLNGGVKISKLGIGTWAWGDKSYWNYDPSQDIELQETYNYCLQKGGVNFFDTAEVYGRGKSELLLGRFKRSFNDVKPMIASKFAPVPWKRGAEPVVAACRSTLDRLGVDTLGLYQIHWPTPLANEGYWDGLAQCYERGWIRSVGVSNYGPNQLRTAHKYLTDRGIPFATNQVQYSLLSRTAEFNKVIETAEELGVTTIAYSPLGQGLLSGKYTFRNRPKGPRSAIAAAVLPRAGSLLKSIKRVADAKTESLGFPVTMSQVAINWCISKGTVPIVGARNVEQATDICNTLKWSLTTEEVVMLDAISRDFRGGLINPLQGISLPSRPRLRAPQLPSSSNSGK